MNEINRTQIEEVSGGIVPVLAYLGCVAFGAAVVVAANYISKNT